MKCALNSISVAIIDSYSIRKLDIYFYSASQLIIIKFIINWLSVNYILNTNKKDNKIYFMSTKYLEILLQPIEKNVCRKSQNINSTSVKYDSYSIFWKMIFGGIPDGQARLPKSKREQEMDKMSISCSLFQITFFIAS